MKNYHLTGKFLLFLGVLFIVACDFENSLITSEIDAEPDLVFIEIFKDDLNLEKNSNKRMASSWISRNKGGKLINKYDGSLSDNDKFKDTRAFVSLKVLPNSVDELVKISLYMTRRTLFGAVDMEYSPHGLHFTEPAILNFIGINLDLSHIPEDIIDQIKLYYVNQDSGEWEEMEVEKIRFDLEHGYLRIKNAQLPHFSRYAMAYGK